MAIVNKKIVLTDTVLLTVPNGSRYAITTLLLCNTASADTGGGNDIVDLHQCPTDKQKVMLIQC